MTRSRNNSKRENTFLGYIDVKLDEPLKKEYAKWAATVDNVWDLLDEYAENGYRVGVSWDNYNETYQCNVTTSDDKNENCGYVLVGRGSTTFRAVLQAIFKDRAVAQGRWKQFANMRTKDWD